MDDLHIAAVVVVGIHGARLTEAGPLDERGNQRRLDLLEQKRIWMRNWMLFSIHEQRKEPWGTACSLVMLVACCPSLVGGVPSDAALADPYAI